jgi:dihydroxyacid dehydratase/phosphogluconate dehydratase
MTMGTASTMASMVEALGMTLPAAAAIPAVDARRYTLAHLTGVSGQAIYFSFTVLLIIISIFVY